MDKSMNRRQFARNLGMGAATLAVGGCASLQKRAEKKPNFIIIFTDDQGYQDVGCFGSPLIKTPNLDRMAAEGMRFTDSYVAAPVCSASRSALMTGCYPLRVDIPGVIFPPVPYGLNPDEITIAEVLKGQGYATACVGKWHLGHFEEFLPTSQGFDSYYGIPYSNDMAIERDGEKGPPLMRDLEIIEHPAEQSTLTKRYTQEAVKFIESNQGRPFFLYLPHTMPHLPLAVSKDFEGKSARGLYGDVIEEIDWSVGEVLNTVRRLGIEEDTVVVFTSDNGPWLVMGERGGSALPLRAGKGTLYEGGMREPCIMWWPGHIPSGSTCSELATTMDLLPTFALLAGTHAPTDRIIDGHDIRPLMLGEPGAKTPYDAFFFMAGAVRSGNWKYHPYRRHAQPVRGADGKPTGETQVTEIPEELFDLAEDISETNNLADKYPEVAERLDALLKDHNKEIERNRRPHRTLTPEDFASRPPGAQAPIPEQYRQMLFEKTR